MTDDGWTKSYRRLWTHPVFRNFRDAAVWSYLIDNAAWRDGTDAWFHGRRIMLMEGQIVASERELADGFCCDRQVVRRILSNLESHHMITREKTTDYTIITICNYKSYQGSSEDEKPTENPPIAQGKPTENPPYIDKKINNSKTDADDDAHRFAHIAVTKQIFEIMGVSADDQSWFGSMARVQMWIKRGWSPDEVIIPAVRRMMLRRAGQGPPNGINYVEKVVASYAAELSRPIPEVTNVHGTRQHARSSDRLKDQFAELDRLCGDGPIPVEPFGDLTGGPIIDNPAQRH